MPHSLTTPACWSWPATDADRTVGAAAGDDDGPKVLREWQQNRCAGCGDEHNKGMGGPLVKDHDHVTGLIRGWLCRRCNTGEAADSFPWAPLYRERNPASILGVRARYWSPVSGWAKPEPPLTPEQARRVAGLLHVPYVGPAKKGVNDA